MNFFTAAFPIFVGLNPAAIHLGFFNRLQHVPLNSLDVDFVDFFGGKWPGGQEGLIDQVFFVRARR